MKSRGSTKHDEKLKRYDSPRKMADGAVWEVKRENERECCIKVKVNQ